MQPPSCSHRFIELRRVRRAAQVPLNNGRSQYLQHGGQWAPFGYPVPIKRHPNDKDDNGYGLHSSKRNIANTPTDIVLYVDYEGHSKHGAGTETKVPPVEERGLLLPFTIVVIIELISTKALQRRLMPPCAQRDEIQCQEEGSLMGPYGAAAYVSRNAASWWLKGRHELR